MILCVTPNPALDRTLTVKGFASGGVFRPQEHMVAAGGKGLNVARAIQKLGQEAVCAGLLGGFSGQYLADMVQKEGMKAHWTWLAEGETRTCMILVDPETLLTTVVNEPGPLATDADWVQLRGDLHTAAADATFIAFSGSLPPGSSPELYASLVADLITSSKQVWVDTSGKSLTAVAQLRGVNIKVNDEEAAELTNIPIHNPSDALAAARHIHAMTGECVVITLGAQGAVLFNAAEAWYAVAPEITIKSGVGSGDSFLAGLLATLTDKASLPEALKAAVAAGTANALSIGGGSFTRLEFEEVLRQIQVVRL